MRRYLNATKHYTSAYTGRCTYLEAAFRPTPRKPAPNYMSTVSIDPIQAAVVTMRRSGRVFKEIPVVLSGSDTAGRHFSEQTKTLVLSRHGASVVSHYKLIPEQEVYLRTPANNREIEVRICGEIGERDDGHIYGMAFADSTADFWEFEFPPAEALPKGLIRVTLECSGCHRRTPQQFDATEMDVYVVNEGALRYCTSCGLSTIWRIATERTAPAAPPAELDLQPLADAIAGSQPTLTQSMPPQSLAPQPAPLPNPRSVALSGLPQPNRRSERRTRVKFDACVRASGIAEEIVPCQDMSRGGFCFLSSRRYSIETMIEAAVPYTPGMSIFVAAQIVNARELHAGLFRYGVAYIRSVRK